MGEGDGRKGGLGWVEVCRQLTAECQMERHLSCKILEDDFSRVSSAS